MLDARWRCLCLPWPNSQINLFGEMYMLCRLAGTGGELPWATTALQWRHSTSYPLPHSWSARIFCFERRFGQDQVAVHGSPVLKPLQNSLLTTMAITPCVYLAKKAIGAVSFVWCYSSLTPRQAAVCRLPVAREVNRFSPFYISRQPMTAHYMVDNGIKACKYIQ